MELFVNGKSCGKKNVENCLAVFDVVLPFGSSTLEAKGFGEKLTGDAGRKDGNTEDVMNIWYNPLPDQAYKAGSWGYIGGENKSIPHLRYRIRLMDLFIRFGVKATWNIR